MIFAKWFWNCGSQWYWWSRLPPNVVLSNCRKSLVCRCRIIPWYHRFCPCSISLLCYLGNLGASLFRTPLHFTTATLQEIMTQKWCQVFSQRLACISLWKNRIIVNGLFVFHFPRQQWQQLPMIIKIGSSVLSWSPFVFLAKYQVCTAVGVESVARVVFCVDDIDRFRFWLCQKKYFESLFCEVASRH